MSKSITYHDAAREALLCGATRLADAVACTLGPKGRNVVLHNPPAPPVVTNDGASIAREIRLEAPMEDLGAQILAEAAARTHDLRGDGTTTATVLAYGMLREGLRNMAAGANPLELNRGMQLAAQVAAAAVAKIARPATERAVLEQVAVLAADSAEIGRLAADAMEQVGPEGVLTVEESDSRDTTLKLTMGMEFERGLLSEHFITDSQAMTCEFENPLLFLTDLEISTSRELAPILEFAAGAHRPLLVVAEKLSEEALSTLILNKLHGNLQVAAVDPPAYAEGRRLHMEDLAIFTGGVYVTAQTGHYLHNFEPGWLGQAKSVRISRRSTTIVGGNGDMVAIEARMRELRAQISQTDYDFNRERFRTRLASFASGVAVLQIGGITKTEMQERKLRADDAVHAIRAARAEGVVPGGGTALIRAIPAVQAYADTLAGDQKTGAQIVLRALEAPLRQIAANAGADPGTIVAGVRSSGGSIGYEALSGQLCDLTQAGILDPAGVTRTALLSAASAVGAILTTEAGLTE